MREKDVFSEKSEEERYRKKKQRKREQKKEKQKKEKRKTVQQWLTLVVAIVGAAAAVAAFLQQRANDDYQQQKDEEAQQEKESSLRPHFTAEPGGKIPIGMQNYYKVYLRNFNEEILLSGGVFGFEYLVVVDAGDEPTVFFWEEMIAYPETEFNPELSGCHLFIREDYIVCERKIREICSQADLKDYTCHSYVFFCFQYVQDGQEKDTYYLLEFGGEEAYGAIELTHPDIYKEGIRMEL
ncbi:hypothetical protein [Acetatifactor muris]|uniref:hypothetical protein n=1 Tax=Acetatifactor muris TaxID=879566 RepID=UPI0023F40F38|nr:hypothetical protein [Acetatifactor muris]